MLEQRAGAATMAGPVMKPWAMKSRRVHRRLVALVPDRLVETQRARALLEDDTCSELPY